MLAFLSSEPHCHQNVPILVRHSCCGGFDCDTDTDDPCQSQHLLPDSKWANRSICNSSLPQLLGAQIASTTADEVASAVGDGNASNVAKWSRFVTRSYYNSTGPNEFYCFLFVFPIPCKHFGQATYIHRVSCKIALNLQIRRDINGQNMVKCS